MAEFLLKLKASSGWSLDQDGRIRRGAQSPLEYVYGDVLGAPFTERERVRIMLAEDNYKGGWRRVALLLATGLLEK